MEIITPIEHSEDSLSSNYIVGVGASAGGLEAINEFFDNMPVDTGFSFIVVQHLSPNHKSLMAELLSKHTEMPVFESEDGSVIRPNSIYLIPAGQHIMLKNNRIRLERIIRDRRPNTSIDIFLDSLAKDKAEKAIGIILSGTGTDGTKGIQAIKERGGTIVVQDPVTAQFDGMPNSAIASGYVDLILSPDMMPEELLEFIKEAPLLRAFNALSHQEEAILQNILEMVHKTTGHDFSDYKRPTINRRLAKRMAERAIRSLPDYFHYLEGHTDEVKLLCKEFLLHVTRFFRDEEAFEQINLKILPDLLARKQPNETLKIWTVACSTGEEAYSLAMLLEENREKARFPNLEIKIFATDISQEVIDIASKGFYPDEQMKTVGPERLKKFFLKESKGYRVTPAIRRMVVFAKHDILKDPPFSKIDFLSCRNMLIYMNAALQKRILQKFHFALIENGYLFLGPSENLGILKDVMKEIDKKWKLYKCIDKTKVADLETFSNPSEMALTPFPATHARSKNALNNLTEIFNETLFEEHDYAGIFIDKNFDVKQAIGHFKRFMEFPESSFNFNLLKLVPPDLSIALSTGIRKAMKDNERFVQRNIRFVAGKQERMASIIIKPYLTQKNYMQPFIFVIIKEEENIRQKTNIVPFSGEGLTEDRIGELERELNETKENLQTLLEEVESSNEELQSSNEEIISSNEELQSTNEELQSLNEELHTVNAEHQLKIKELIELNDDLNNYFRNTDIGQILVDRKLIIRKFTPVATKQVNLIASDIGRSIVDISTNMRGLSFINDIKSVMQQGHLLEKEIAMEDEKVYLMRIAPYVRQNKTVDGVVVNFIDISDVKRLSNFLEAVFNSSTSGILALKTLRDEKNEAVDFEFISANQASQSLLGLEAPILHRTFREMYGADHPAFEKYKKVVETGNTSYFEFFDTETNHWNEVTAVKMMDGLVITFDDITDRKTSSEKLTTSNYKLQQSNLDLLQFASVASHDLKEPLRKIQVFGNLLKESVPGKLTSMESNYLDKIVNSSNRMQLLIDNILILSRLSINDTPHSEINLNELIGHLIDDLEISIKDKGVIFKLQPLPLVKGIPGQIHQLFQNLISNAIKFNQGHPVIEIGVQPLTPLLKQEFDIHAGDYTAFYIQDNGIGFEERYTEKIFGLFQRLDKTNYQGTGIGLSIVKKIMDNHKGFIKAISQPGEGARFILLLPE